MPFAHLRLDDAGGLGRELLNGFRIDIEFENIALGVASDAFLKRLFPLRAKPQYFKNAIFEKIAAYLLGQA